MFFYLNLGCEGNSSVQDVVGYLPGQLRPGPEKISGKAWKENLFFVKLSFGA